MIQSTHAIIIDAYVNKFHCFKQDVTMASASQATARASNEYTYRNMWSLLLTVITKVQKQNIRIKLEKNISHRRVCVCVCVCGGGGGGGSDACWVRHFCVEPGIFVVNRAFLCRRTMHNAVERDFLCPTSIIKTDLFSHLLMVAENNV